ncbi:MAG: IS3 family transposase, partial [Bacillota bacterium]|nr:IS3 family transposase [Bacillota bacterium]MDU5083482.1 IS3 family transposase [Bacillota bacterium]
EKYIKYYNEKRIKEKLGWMSPVEYRLSLSAA